MSDLTSVTTGLSKWARALRWLRNAKNTLAFYFIPQSFKALSVEDKSFYLQALSHSWFDKICRLWGSLPLVFCLITPIALSLMGACTGLIVGFPILFTITSAILSAGLYMGLTAHHNTRFENLHELKVHAKAAQAIGQSVQQVASEVKQATKKQYTTIAAAGDALQREAQLVEKSAKKLKAKSRRLSQATGQLSDAQQEVTRTLSSTAVCLKAFNQSMHALASREKALQKAEIEFIEVVRQAKKIQQRLSSQTQQRQDLALQHKQNIKEHFQFLDKQSEEIKDESKAVDALIARHEHLFLISESSAPKLLSAGSNDEKRLVVYKPKAHQPSQEQLYSQELEQHIDVLNAARLLMQEQVAHTEQQQLKHNIETQRIVKTGKPLATSLNQPNSASLNEMLTWLNQLVDESEMLINERFNQEYTDNSHSISRCM